VKEGTGKRIWCLKRKKEKMGSFIFHSGRVSKSSNNQTGFPPGQQWSRKWGKIK
jgi:hypothetical protein